MTRLPFLRGFARVAAWTIALIENERAAEAVAFMLDPLHEVVRPTRVSALGSQFARIFARVLTACVATQAAMPR